MESGQIMEMVLMQERLRSQWSYDERDRRREEAHRPAREARAPRWALLVGRLGGRRAAAAAPTTA